MLALIVKVSLFPPRICISTSILQSFLASLHLIVTRIVLVAPIYPEASLKVSTSLSGFIYS